MNYLENAKECVKYCDDISYNEMVMMRANTLALIAIAEELREMNKITSDIDLSPEECDHVWGGIIHTSAGSFRVCQKCGERQNV